MYRITSALGFNKRNGDPLDLQDKEKHVARRNNKSRSKAPTRRRRGTLAETQDSGSSYPGMVNLSGTLCYMNSILQAFASLDFLQDYLTRIINLAETVDLNTPVIDALDTTLQELNTPSPNRPPPIRPYHFIEALSQLPSVRRLLQTREQQDAHELFLLLTNAVAEELQALEKERRIDKGLSVILDRTRIQKDTDGNRHIKVDKDMGTEKERLLSPWEGLRAIRRNCLVCGWCEVIRHEVTGAIDVTVPMNGLASLQSCLRASMAAEMIDDAYCDSCTLDLTINYYTSEEQRLMRNAADNQTSVDAEPTARTSRMAVETPTTANSLGNIPIEKEAVASKPTSAKKRRAREARAILRKLEDVKSQGSIGEVVGEGKAKAKGLGLQDVKWVKGTGPSSRTTMIARPPRILALHLNRSGFTPYGQLIKKTSQIAFPTILDLSPLTTTGAITMDSKQPISSEQPAPSQTEPAPEVLYRLDGIICHYGYTHSSGHFVAYRRKPTSVNQSDADRILHPRGNWLRISDADVTEVPESAVLGERGNAFLLFYEQIQGLVQSNRTSVLPRDDNNTLYNSAAMNPGQILDQLNKRKVFTADETSENTAGRPPVDSLD